MNDNLYKVLKNFSEATDLNIYVFSNSRKLIGKFTTPLAPVFPDVLLKKLDKRNDDLSLLLIKNRSSTGKIKYQDLSIIGWNANFTISNNSNYDRLAPLLGWDKFIQTMRCLYFMIFDRWPNISKETKKLDIGDNLYSLSAKKASYKGYLVENELMDIVSKGNIKLYNKYFRNFVINGNIGEFGHNKLRNEKDLAIAATTLYTRAAIKGGLAASEAYGLSDKIINQIEEDVIISNYFEYSRAIGEIFINRVYRLKRNNITPLVYKAQEYIYENLVNIKSVKEIAESLGTSLSYLQHLFKKDTKVSLIKFINQEKLNLAKHELIFSEKKIEDIANDVGFNSFSVFSRTFKKIEKITPLQYRKKLK